MNGYSRAVRGSRSPDRPPSTHRLAESPLSTVDRTKKRDTCPPHHWTSYWTNEKRTRLRFLERIFSQVQAMKTKRLVRRWKGVSVA
jgi:hypothetical protein